MRRAQPREGAALRGSLLGGCPEPVGPAQRLGALLCPRTALRGPGRAGGAIGAARSPGHAAGEERRRGTRKGEVPALPALAVLAPASSSLAGVPSREETWFQALLVRSETDRANLRGARCPSERCGVTACPQPGRARHSRGGPKAAAFAAEGEAGTVSVLAGMDFAGQIPRSRWHSSARLQPAGPPWLPGRWLRPRCHAGRWRRPREPELRVRREQGPRGGLGSVLKRFLGRKILMVWTRAGADIIPTGTGEGAW